MGRFRFRDVTIGIGPDCRLIATLAQKRVVQSEDGVTRVMVWADRVTGVCRIVVQVDNVGQMTHIYILVEINQWLVRQEKI